MNKILLIIRREYFTRIRNKSFIILTLVAPLFYVALIGVSVLGSTFGKDQKTISVFDPSQTLRGALKNTDLMKFEFLPLITPSADTAQMKEANPYLLMVPAQLDIFKPEGMVLIADKKVGVGTEGEVEAALADAIRTRRMVALRISRGTVDSLRTTVKINTRVYSDRGAEEASSGATSAAAGIGGFLIYIFIFLYGGLVLRGVQEEKQNRVVEVIVSSVRPFQLMMGKIIGVALVGLTQFVLWIVLTLALSTVFGAAMSPGSAMGMGGGMASPGAGADAYQSVSSAFGTINWVELAGWFLFYFLGGYLLYASFFAAFAASVDNQSDIYQFMFPISLPVIIAITLIPAVIDSPDSSLAFWLSVIPLTAPISMMARIPFGVPLWQLLLSAGLLAITFVGAVWLAGRIYRVGILMYGKKITIRELSKWVFYSR